MSEATFIDPFSGLEKTIFIESLPEAMEVANRFRFYVGDDLMQKKWQELYDIYSDLCDKLNLSKKWEDYMPKSFKDCKSISFGSGYAGTPYCNSKIKYTTPDACNICLQEKYLA